MKLDNASIIKNKLQYLCNDKDMDAALVGNKEALDKLSESDEFIEIFGKINDISKRFVYNGHSYCFMITPDVQPDTVMFIPVTRKSKMTLCFEGENNYGLQ